MATYSRRELITRRVEFPVPAQPPFGACWAEVDKARHAATQELRAAGRLGKDETPSDDMIRMLAGDDEIIVYYETGQSMGALIDRLRRVVGSWNSDDQGLKNQIWAVIGKGD